MKFFTDKSVYSKKKKQNNGLELTLFSEELHVVNLTIDAINNYTEKR